MNASSGSGLCPRRISMARDASSSGLRAYGATCAWPSRPDRRDPGLPEGDLQAQAERRPRDGDRARTRLHVSPASASAMVKKLAALDLARARAYRGVELTPAGERVALEVIRHHRLLELYLARDARPARRRGPRRGRPARARPLRGARGADRPRARLPDARPARRPDPERGTSMAQGREVTTNMERAFAPTPGRLRRLGPAQHRDQGGHGPPPLRAGDPRRRAAAALELLLPRPRQRC